MLHGSLLQAVNISVARLECLRYIKLQIENMNAYGRIIHKKAKGCSYFYKLLTSNDKKDGWDSASRSMERDLTDLDPNYIFDRDVFFLIVKK